MKTRKTRSWEDTVVNCEEVATMDEIRKAKYDMHAKLGKGKAPSSAMTGLFERLRRKKIEDPLKFAFPNIKVAENFTTACRRYAMETLKLTAGQVVISRCNSTVYIYNQEVW